MKNPSNFDENFSSSLKAKKFDLPMMINSSTKTLKMSDFVAFCDKIAKIPRGFLTLKLKHS